MGKKSKQAIKMIETPKRSNESPAQKRDRTCLYVLIGIVSLVVLLTIADAVYLWYYANYVGDSTAGTMLCEPSSADVLVEVAETMKNVTAAAKANGAALPNGTSV